MRPPRRLSAEEAALWRKVAGTVTPLERRKVPPRKPESAPTKPPPEPVNAVQSKPAPSVEVPLFALLMAKQQERAARTPAIARRLPPARIVEDRTGLDASWERKITKGVLEPDFSLDLHGAGLDAAYVRLMRGLTQAKAMGARVVLIVTGKPRPVEAADRGQARGAIRAKIADWLAASEHASDIAAVRGAHRRHGGQGALYVVLKKGR